MAALSNVHAASLLNTSLRSGTYYLALFLTDPTAAATGTDDKELYLVPGATHIQTYWVPEYVEQITKKLVEFFGAKL